MNDHSMAPHRCDNPNFDTDFHRSIWLWPPKIGLYRPNASFIKNASNLRNRHIRELASQESGFSKIHKKVIWTYQPRQLFMQKTVLESKSDQNRPRTRLRPIFEKIDFSCRAKYGHETLKNSRSRDARLGIQSCTQKTQFYMVSDRCW